MSTSELSLTLPEEVSSLNLLSVFPVLVRNYATLDAVGEQGAVRSIDKSELRTLPSDIEYMLT